MNIICRVDGLSGTGTVRCSSQKRPVRELQQGTKRGREREQKETSISDCEVSVENAAWLQEHATMRHVQIDPELHATRTDSGRLVGMAS